MVKFELETLSHSTATNTLLAKIHPEHYSHPEIQTLEIHDQLITECNILVQSQVIDEEYLQNCIKREHKRVKKAENKLLRSKKRLSKLLDLQQHNPDKNLIDEILTVQKQLKSVKRKKDKYRVIAYI